MYLCLGIHISGLLGSGTVDCHYQKQTLIWWKPTLVSVPVRFVRFLRHIEACFGRCISEYEILLASLGQARKGSVLRR